MDYYIGYCPNVQYGTETRTFPSYNFPDFPGRNAFVEVSGRGGGEDPFHIQAIQVCYQLERRGIEHFRNNII
jgi:hypothetical protein